MSQNKDILRPQRSLLELIESAFARPNVKSIAGALRRVADDIDEALEWESRIKSNIVWRPLEDEYPEHYVIVDITEHFNKEYW